ncbi:MAG: hypothetical protein Ct9H300mP11_10320 [Chloroflexota bacterium]|nr:MAG: hypothetical protein Ct9H300mP11_10320 [Chloroflexota bacterium]
MATTNKKRNWAAGFNCRSRVVKIGAFATKDSRDLFVEAFQDRVSEYGSRLRYPDIECAYVGNYSSDLFEHQGHTAPIVADWLGITLYLSPALRMPAPAAAVH